MALSDFKLDSLEDAVRLWPWIRGTNRILDATVPGPLPTDHLICATDFSGTHHKSKYWVCSCLIADAGLSDEWPSFRAQIRAEFLPNHRKMSYKALNDGHRQRALPYVLGAANSLTGIVCTIAVHNDYKWMTSTPDTPKHLMKIGALDGKWGQPAFEYMMRAVLIWAVTLGRVCGENQDVTWIIDQDDIAANDDRLTDLLNYAGRFSHPFLRGQMRELAVNTTAIDGDDLGFEDFVAIPDLCAGMFAEFANTWDVTELAEGRWKYESYSEKDKAEYLCDWYFSGTGMLRRVAIAITTTPNGGYLVQRIRPEILVS